MQKFILTIEVTVNTMEEVSVEEVHEEILPLLEDWAGGPIEIKSVEEI